MRSINAANNKLTMQTRQSFEARLIQATAQLLGKIESQDFHPDLRDALKDAILENHNQTIKLIQNGKFDWAIAKENLRR